MGLHELNERLAELARDLGPWAYAALAALVFFQIAFLIGPIVPGNPLLFAAGMLAHPGGPLSWPTLWMALSAAAIAGGVVGFHIGSAAARSLRGGRSRLRPEHWERTEAFFRRHGPRAVAVAYFVPFVRSFAPFAAGMGEMPRAAFLAATVIGATLWCGALVVAGAFFGHIPAVRQNLGLALAAVFVYVAVSIALKSRRRGATSE